MTQSLYALPFILYADSFQFFILIYQQKYGVRFSFGVLPPRKKKMQKDSPIASDAVTGKSVSTPSTEKTSLSMNERYSAKGS